MTPEAYRNDWSKKNATVMGLGEFGGGVAVVQFLAKHNANITLTDLKTKTQLESSLQLIQHLDIANYRLGEHHPDDFLNADFIVVNPAVKPDNPFLQLAIKNNIPVTTELGLFIQCHQQCHQQHNRATVIAVTGTNGKSTTASLIHSILSQSARTCWLGGNIGTSLLNQLDRIAPNDFVVLEVSSFQLHRLREANISFAPDVAVLTNLAPNHLDWHGSFAEYQSAKQFLFESQQANQFAVLPAECCDFPNNNSQTIFLPRCPVVTPDHLSACSHFIEGEKVGRQTASNIQAAVQTAQLLGIADNHIVQGLANFERLPCRLENIGTVADRTFIDDSQATTPESAICAIENFTNEPLLLFIGGVDKGADLSDLVAAIAAAKNIKAIALMGQTGEQLQEQLIAQSNHQARNWYLGKNFQDCFDWVWRLSEPDDFLLLSPGCASAGWFKNYRDRSQQFRKQMRLAKIIEKSSSSSLPE